MMMNAQVAQVAAALLVAATPWIVVRIALAAASRHSHAPGGPVPPLTALALLDRATAVAAFVVGTFAALLPAPSAWMAVVDLVAFAGLSPVALRALHDLDDATRATRYLDAVTRAASLAPRRHHDYLPAYWRIVLFGVTIAGLASFSWRATIPSSSDRRLFLPVVFALIASAFWWLYEAWIHGLATGPTVSDSNDVDHERRRSIRRVFAGELILVTGFLTLAHGLLDLDWAASGAWAAVAAVGGGVLGVIGCSLALSSDLSTRRFAPSRDSRDLASFLQSCFEGAFDAHAQVCIGLSLR